MKESSQRDTLGAWRRELVNPVVLPMFGFRGADLYKKNPRNVAHSTSTRNALASPRNTPGTVYAHRDPQPPAVHWPRLGQLQRASTQGHQCPFVLMKLSQLLLIRPCTFVALDIRGLSSHLLRINQRPDQTMAPSASCHVLFTIDSTCVVRPSA